MKYILIKNTYRVTTVKNKMVNIADLKSKEGRDWYQYYNPEENGGFKVIHKSNVLLIAANQKELAEQIKANAEIRAKCLEAWQQENN